ncbi:hypothetical protein [Actinotalea solisilvae]|uniref:hypothetical protein n=1 Tax=Actinotalea solisilvae TaxID=2072922 RepID=UPI0018F196AF|nr:hypothetical protein [Actinotalea solisilvae]
MTRTDARAQTAADEGTVAGAAAPVDARLPGDLVAHWSSDGFRDDATAWVRAALDPHGVALRGPLEVHRVRFWSAVLSATTDAGRVWFKATNPGQSFEATLLARLGRLAPDDVVVPLAVDSGRGWLLLPDAGPAVRDRGAVTTGDWEALVAHAARLQVALRGHHTELAAAGLPALDAGQAEEHVTALVERLRRLPPGDPQRVAPDEARALLRGLRGVAQGFDELARSGIPSTFQPGDVSVGNAVPRDGGGFRLFDVGDAFWSHPFAALQVPVRMATGSWPGPPAPDDAVAARLGDAVLDAWGIAPGADAARLVEAADRLASVQRCESWRRLLAHADPDRLGVPTPRLADWLADAVRPLSRASG